MKMALQRTTTQTGTLRQIWRDKRQCKPTQSQTTTLEYLRLYQATISDYLRQVVQTILHHYLRLSQTNYIRKQSKTIFHYYQLRPAAQEVTIIEYYRIFPFQIFVYVCQQPKINQRGQLTHISCWDSFKIPSTSDQASRRSWRRL